METYLEIKQTLRILSGEAGPGLGGELCQKNPRKVCQESLNNDTVIELEADFAVKLRVAGGATQ